MSRNINVYYHDGQRYIDDLSPYPLTIFIMGLPRSGSSILAAYINSIEGSMIVGEPHRSAGKAWANPFVTPVGDFRLDPSQIVFQQVRDFADENNLDLCGIKEVVDPSTETWPLYIADANSMKINTTLVSVREPRRNYQSILDLGHGDNISKEIFLSQYTEMLWRCLNMESWKPVVLELFRMNPQACLASALAQPAEYWQPAGRLLNYVGGGDARVMAGTTVNRCDGRGLYMGDGFDEAVELYLEVFSQSVWAA